MTELLKLQLSGLRKYLIKRAYMRSLRRWLPKHRYVQFERFSRKLRIDRHDLEQAALETDCIREPENIFIFRALARQGLCKRFIDLGANYGHIALKVLPHYADLVLVDANPNAVAFLREMFADQKRVQIRHCAVVGDEATKTVNLVVPRGRSGLAHVVDAAVDQQTAFECPAVTLDRLLAHHTQVPAYIKIDVEGLEDSVIRGGKNTVRNPRMIVGFEAWSRAAATKCCKLFSDHLFYSARFAFLNRSGALCSSPFGLLRAFFTGGAISIYRFNDIVEAPFNYFSQVIAVPRVIQSQFEDAIRAEWLHLGGTIDLATI